MSAITRVQGNARGTTTSSTLTITMGAAPTAGNLLILTYGSGGSGYITISSISQTGVTWTLAKQKEYNSMVDDEIWYGVVGSSPSATITVNLSGAPSSYGAVGNVCEYTIGTPAIWTLDQTASATDSGTTLVTGTTGTTYTANEVIVGSVVIANTGQTTPVGNSFALLDGAQYEYISDAYLEYIASATGTFSSSTTVSGAHNSVGAIATFYGIPLTVDVNVSDSGSGSDALAVGAIPISVSDSGSGSDATAITANMTVTETGSGSDSVTSGGPVDVSDSGLGSDAASVLAQVGPVLPIFADSFQSGDFSAWSNEYFNAGNFLTVSSAVTYNNEPFSASVYINEVGAAVGGAGSYATVNKVFAESQSPIYCRFYVYLTELPGPVENDAIILFTLYNGEHDLVEVGLVRKSGNLEFRADENYPSEIYSYSSPVDFQANTWYCIEVGYVQDPVNGAYYIFFNGTQVLNDTGLNTSAGDATSIACPSNRQQGTLTYPVVYTDCVVMANTYIGPIGYGLSDIGLAVDVASTPGVISVSDICTGDAGLIMSWPIGVSDAVSGADSASMVVATQIPVSDTSSGADAVASLQAQIPVLDAGAGAESIGVQGAIPVSDVGSGADSAIVGSPVNVSDSGLGSDILVAVNVQVLISDVGLGTDALAAIIAQILATDLGLGTDSLLLGIPVNLSDLGLGTDSLLLGTPVNLSDSGLGSDVVVIKAQVFLSDIGTGLDVAVIVGTLPTHAIIIQTEKGNVTLQSDSD
ncbi:MAG: hypothetical protein ABSC20_09660 [Candidatus Bathyarchaeia archaeon]